MSRLIEKIKLPLAVILSAGLIIGFSAVVSTLYHGRFSAVTAMNESVSVINNEKPVSVEDVMTDVDGIFIPQEIKNQQINEIRTIKCKTYTEYILQAENCTFTVRKYNYAYLPEDDSLSFPENTEKININGIDVFIYSRNGMSNALYYSELSRCIIETKGNVKDFLK